ncbi:MAG: M23 family metallopeptidase [Rhodobacterales bacterium]|nr:M23 family metallopeptidase [Rhodobacterales bacterium]
MRNLAVLLAGVLTLAAPSLAKPAGAAEAGPLRLDWPLDCQPGTTCWIVNLMDHDNGPGFKDYRCGTKGSDGNKGTGIAVRDTELSGPGVKVLAAADGTVLGQRDGMDDVDVRKIGLEAVKGRRCGNGMRIDHGGGWITQYCHLRNGSVTVKKGDKVTRGQPLGLVGLSGGTTFPNLHFQVEHDGHLVDPFVGLTRTEACRPGPAPLWADWPSDSLNYASAALSNIGFATTWPKADAARTGLYDDSVLPGRAPMLILWADIYWSRKGDQMTFTIQGPDGAPVLDYQRRLKKTSLGRHLLFAGKRKAGQAWPAGAYTGTVTLKRDKGPDGPETHTIISRIQIR